ncbi:MAG TPA: hypothetical protein VFV95_17195 [Vicinamibacterales bacterium]|nr:hypothetical protein [Vicinamibacterales bacterium]
MDSVISRGSDAIAADHISRQAGHLNVTVDGVRILMAAVVDEQAGLWQWTVTSVIGEARPAGSAICGGMMPDRLEKVSTSAPV